MRLSEWLNDSDLYEIEYVKPTLKRAYVCNNIRREQVKTSQWILMDDVNRDRVRNNAQLSIESLKVMRSIKR